MLRRLNPIPDNVQECFLTHPGVGKADDFGPILFRQAPQGWKIAGQHRPERFYGILFRLFQCQGPDAIEREHGLGVERLLHPERAVLVEHGDAILDRDEGLAGRVSRYTNEVQDRSLGRPLCPLCHEASGSSAVAVCADA